MPTLVDTPPSKKRKIVVLTLTEDCNLACSYCFEKAKTKSNMEIRVAKEIVEHEFNNSEGFDEIEFDLFGGEPCLRKDLIKELVSWTCNKGFPKPYLFFLETNGTLVHGDFQRWLLENRDHVHAGLSLDGTPATHNRNRSNSYDRIDTQFFVRTYPSQSVRMTITSDGIPTLSQDIIHLHSLGFSEIMAVFAYGVTWDIATVQGALSSELKKLCDFYIAHPDIRECSVFDMSLAKIANRNSRGEKWCGTGTSMVSYGTDGKKYPCHTFQSNTTVSSSPIEYADIDFNKIGTFADPACSNCLLESVCPNCYGMNYVTNGDILKRDKQLCDIVKTRALATSYLKAAQIASGAKVLPPAEAYQTIKAIRMVQHEFAQT